VSLPAVAAGALLIVAFLAVKMLSKLAGVWPLTRAFAFDRRDGAFTTLLMSTGLTLVPGRLPRAEDIEAEVI
jgi:Kef-type K+ transport system membrane component KefB